MASFACGTRDRPYMSAARRRGSRTTGPQLGSIPVAVASLLHHLAGAAVWRWNGSFSDICLLRLFFWEGPLFCC